MLVMVFSLLLNTCLVSGEWTNELSLLPSNPILGNFYGRSVNTFGDYTIVGDNSAATIYTMPVEDWEEHSRLTPPPSLHPNSSFAFSVALDNNFAIVTAPHVQLFGSDNLISSDDTSNQSTSLQPASVYIYDKSESGLEWKLSTAFTSLQPGYDGFGYSVSIGADVIAIGAPFSTNVTHGYGSGYGVTTFNQDGSVNQSSPYFSYHPSIGSVPPSTVHMGAVYIYRRLNGSWTFDGIVVPMETNANDHFGWSVDLAPDGGRLVVGAPGDKLDGDESGTVFVYIVDSMGKWHLETRLTASDEEPYDNFGYSVGIESNDIIIGTRSARSAYVFHRLVDTWIQDAKLVASDTQLNDGFGQAVSIFGAFAAVGSPYHQGKGSVYLWEFNMEIGDWVQLKKVTSTMPGSQMGICIALGSRFLIAGAPNTNSGIGMARTLTYYDRVVETPITDSLDDVVVLIKFSGSPNSMNLLATRKILADAAGTGTAQTEVRIIDLTSSNVQSHVFGLQIRFTKSPTVSPIAAARNLLASMNDIRYRLNAAVGALSGTAEIIPTEVPVQVPSGISLDQFAAIIMLAVVTIFTLALLLFFTAKRRKKIAADKREFDAQEAEKEIKKEQAKKEKRARPKRPNSTLLRKQKRKDRTYMQAENDAAGLSFSENVFDDDIDFPLSPRDFNSVELEHLYSNNDTNESANFDNQALKLDEEGPRLKLDDDQEGPRLKLDDDQEGPRLKMDDDQEGPRLKLDDDQEGPRLKLDDDQEGPKLKMDDHQEGPRLKMDDDHEGPRLKPDSSEENSLKTKYDLRTIQEITPPSIPQSPEPEPLVPLDDSGAIMVPNDLGNFQLMQNDAKQDEEAERFDAENQIPNVDQLGLAVATSTDSDPDEPSIIPYDSDDDDDEPVTQTGKRPIVPRLRLERF